MNPWEMRGKYILPHRSKLTVCSSWVPLSRWIELTTTKIASRLLLSPTLTLIFHIHVQTENSTILYCITKSVALKSNTNIRRRSTPVSGADLGGGCRGCAPPPSPWDDLRFSNTTGILPKKKEKWFIGVEIEQDTSAPPPKKNPGSAPAIPGFPHHASYVMIYFPNARQQDKFRLDTSSALLTHFTFSIPWFTWSEDYNSEARNPRQLPVYSTIPVRALIETWVPISV